MRDFFLAVVYFARRTLRRTVEQKESSGGQISFNFMGTKNSYENGPNPFYLFFSILWEREWSRFV